MYFMFAVDVEKLNIYVAEYHVSIEITSLACEFHSWIGYKC